MPLLTALQCTGHVHLVIGPTPLAASRCVQSLAVGASVVVIGPSPNPSAPLHFTLQKLVDEGRVRWIEEDFRDEFLFTLGREEVGKVADAVFVVRGPAKTENAHISALCRKHRIPINVVDAPDLCTLSLLSVYTDGPLQIGVTTNGNGCKLASRIRREIASSLPAGLGSACSRIGSIRRQLIQEQQKERLEEERQINGVDTKETTNLPTFAAQRDDEEAEETTDQRASFNRLVKEGSEAALKGRKLRWLSQVCEYWPLKRLSEASDAEIELVLSVPEAPDQQSRADGGQESAQKEPGLVSSSSPGRGKIILAGSGPGHPDLLTRSTFHAIQAADVILADKLVPAGVLALIPRRTPVTIARKFPGNADAAQAELHSIAIAAWAEGKTVLRLKQGDPYIYGRGGEEIMFFREHGAGNDVTVLPGITSALSAPLFAGIPATQRDVSDQVLICTGTGKKGVAPTPPEFVPTRTVIFLMALHRIKDLIQELTEHLPSELGDTTTPTRRALFPLSTPCAVIERATCPDQRVIRSTLKSVAQAIEAEGSRPPGLLVVGAACEVLNQKIEEKEPQQEQGKSWVVEDGFLRLDFGVQKDIEAMM
ncbi:uroporphyrin-III C-methyltransferase [Ceratocystis pirilliformis]|uniref:precorrin-2 dehydrogenase n=1 Tax=Ceratocystis pirilliformis TaxID=259994 RepID=A0ABR3Z4U4_9PEZI